MDQARSKAEAGNPNKPETGLGTSTAVALLGQGQGFQAQWQRGPLHTSTWS